MRMWRRDVSPKPTVLLGLLNSNFLFFPDSLMNSRRPGATAPCSPPPPFAARPLPRAPLPHRHRGPLGPCLGSPAAAPQVHPPHGGWGERVDREEDCAESLGDGHIDVWLFSHGR